MTSAQFSRTRRDMCPGVLRPWPASDGLLIRLRLVGGYLSGVQLGALLAVSERFGDGDVHLTSRANLQVRGLAGDRLSDEAVAAFESTGLLPSRTHELVRNIVMSPQTGVAGGRADLRGVASELDRLLLATPQLRQLPGRFLLVLDDGRGDVLDRGCDLGLVALDAARGQLRVGDGWGDIVALDEAAAQIVQLAGRFVDERGGEPDAPWHVRELERPLASLIEPAPEVPPTIGALEYGSVAGGTHHEIPNGILRQGSAAPLLEEPVLVVTPWRGVFVPDASEKQ